MDRQTDRSIINSVLIPVVILVSTYVSIIQVSLRHCMPVPSFTRTNKSVRQLLH